MSDTTTAPVSTDAPESPAPQVVDVPADPTPTFANPVFDRLFKRAKLKSRPVTVEYEDESFDFLVHEMTVSAKGRFEMMLQSISSEESDTEKDDLGLLDGEGDDSGESQEPELSINEDRFGQYKAKLVATCVTTPDRQPICKPDQWATITAMPATVIEPLFQGAFELNGLGSIKKKRETEVKAENE